MKVGCELACRDGLGDDRVLILRLHAIIGQVEDGGPLLWWLGRMRRGGPVLVPAPDRAIQPVDVRDVACFLVDQVERGATGAFNVGAPVSGRSYGDLVRACAEIAAAGPPDLVWADESWLADQDVRPETELPFWRPAPAQWQVRADRAAAAGLRCRPLAYTAAQTWRWLRGGDRKLDRQRITGYGMDPAREADLIARWRAASSLERSSPGSDLSGHRRRRVLPSGTWTRNDPSGALPIQVFS